MPQPSLVVPFHIVFFSLVPLLSLLSLKFCSQTLFFLVSLTFVVAFVPVGVVLDQSLTCPSDSRFHVLYRYSGVIIDTPLNRSSSGW